jgi:uncharacterized membrane protein required for colicin V production
VYLLDYLLSIYVALGAWKGFRRGMETELKSLIGTLLFVSLLSGVWVFAVVREAMSGILKIHPMLAGVSSAIAGFVLAIMFMRMLRNQLPETLARSVAVSSTYLWGAILGLLRRGALGGFFLFVTASAPVAFINSFIVNHSVAAYWIDQLFVIEDVKAPATEMPHDDQQEATSIFDDI